VVGLDDIIDNNIREFVLNWEMYIPQKEKGKQNENTYTNILYKPYQNDVDKFNARSNKDIQTEDLTYLKWIAYKGQFFSSVLIAEERFLNAEIISNKLPEEDKYLKNFKSEIGVAYTGAPASTIPMKFYFGPNHFNNLNQYEELQLKELVSLGGYLSKWINQFVIVPIFNFLDNYIGSYGIIILILTVIIKLALFPLTFKSYQSQAKMRVLKPQIDEINERIPKDKAMERQQATMALYKKVGINPMGGCLPMLLQMPILFAMFRFFPSSIELRQESFLWAHDLSTYDAILEWEQYIPLVSKFYGNHVSLFTLLMTVSTMFSMKFNSSTTSTSQMPGMQGMMYVMPIMFMFVLNNFSSGLTYYYILANMITIGQNAIFKLIIDEDEILRKLEAKKAKPHKKSKFQQRLEEAAKQRGYKPPKRK
jgi:YidC/Oxa1 family membrane protein insertase